MKTFKIQASRLSLKIISFECQTFNKSLNRRNRGGGYRTVALKKSFQFPRIFFMVQFMHSIPIRKWIYIIWKCSIKGMEKLVRKVLLKVSYQSEDYLEFRYIFSVLSYFLFHITMHDFPYNLKKYQTLTLHPFFINITRRQECF